MKWAVATSGTIFCGDMRHISHNLCFVFAANEDEALGKGWRIVFKMLPQASGWIAHHVNVRACGAPAALIEDVEAVEPVPLGWLDDANP